MTSTAPSLAHPARVSWLKRIVFAGLIGLALLGWFARFGALGLETRLDGTEIDDWARAAAEVALASLGEDPGLPSQPPLGALPVCDDVPSSYGRALRLGFGLMRATEEGRRLYDMLVTTGACVGVTDLPYNSAFARAFGSPELGWVGSTIMVDRRYVRSTRADILAALLIHEATHLDRAFSGDACYYRRTCATLGNGVELEEEIAAHTAEARWWIEVFGTDGKRFALRGDRFENRLARAYLDGPDRFRAYVTRIRSDPREGKGLP
ncbi:MAG TPA: hypothetical protein VIL01_07845 [Thermomicrobiales bacterium]